VGTEPLADEHTAVEGAADPDGLGARARPIGDLERAREAAHDERCDRDRGLAELPGAGEEARAARAAGKGGLTVEGAPERTGEPRVAGRGELGLDRVLGRLGALLIIIHEHPLRWVARRSRVA